MRFAAPDGTIVEPRDDCVWEKEKVVEYMGSTVQIKVYYNQ